MARAIVLRTKDDDKLWLINLDERSVSEIAGALIGARSGFVVEAEVIDAPNMRSAAASHPMFAVQ